MTTYPTQEQGHTSSFSPYPTGQRPYIPTTKPNTFPTFPERHSVAWGGFSAWGGIPTLTLRTIITFLE